MPFRPSSRLLLGASLVGACLASPVGLAPAAAAPASPAPAAKPTPALKPFLEAYNPAEPVVLKPGQSWNKRYADGLLVIAESEEERSWTFRKPGMKLAEVLKVVRAFGPEVSSAEFNRNGASLYYTQLNAAGPGGFAVEIKGQGDRFDEVRYAEFWE